MGHGCFRENVEIRGVYHRYDGNRAFFVERRKAVSYGAEVVGGSDILLRAVFGGEIFKRYPVFPCFRFISGVQFLPVRGQRRCR